MKMSKPPKTKTPYGKPRGASGSMNKTASGRPSMTPAPNPKQAAHSNVQAHSKGVHGPKVC